MDDQATIQKAKAVLATCRKAGLPEFFAMYLEEKRAVLAAMGE